MFNVKFDRFKVLFFCNISEMEAYWDFGFVLGISRHKRRHDGFFHLIDHLLGVASL